jgi:hypothetical protein
MLPAVIAELGDGFGLQDHLTGAPGFVRSSAYRILGHGVTMYIVLLTTSGAASCPRVRPVENVQANFRFLTVSVLMSVKVLKRVDA